MELQFARGNGRWMNAAIWGVGIAVVAVPLEALLVPRHVSAGGILPLLAPISAALVLAAAALATLQWYVGRSPAGVWVGAALALLSVRIVVRHVVPLTGRPGEIEVAIGSAAFVSAVLLLAHATATGSRRSTPSTAIGMALVATGAMAFGCVLPLSHSDIETFETAIALWGWSALTIVCGLHARRARDTYVFPALALVAAAFLMQRLMGVAHDELGIAEFGHTIGVVFVGAVVVAISAALDALVVLDSQRTELDAHRKTRALIAERERRERALAEVRAHEAKNALLSIEGAVRVLEQHFDGLPEHMRGELSSGVYAEVKRLQKLVVTAESDEPKPTTIDVAVALTPGLTAAFAEGADLTVDVPRGLRAHADEATVAAAIENVLTNARRHAPGSPIDVSVRQEDDRVLVEVADRGPGVPLEERERIFQRGQRGAASQDVPGSGLGLFVARTSLRRHGGDLEYRDRMGGGSIFRLVLPAAAGVAEPAPAGTGTGIDGRGYR